MTEDMLTYYQAARFFEVAEQTIRSWAAQGLIAKEKKPLRRDVFVSASQIRELLRNAGREDKSAGKSLEEYQKLERSKGT